MKTTPTPEIETTLTSMQQTGPHTQAIAMKVTTYGKFKHAMAKQHGFLLYEPQPCHMGRRSSKAGNWGAEDSFGGFWQDSSSGSYYDTVSYIRSQVRRTVWQDIAHSVGFHLVDPAEIERLNTADVARAAEIKKMIQGAWNLAHQMQDASDLMGALEKALGEVASMLP